MKYKQTHNKHNEVIRDLATIIIKEYRDLIFKNRAVVKDHLEYDIPIGNQKIHGECDLLYADFDIKAAYVFEVKRDLSTNNYLKGKHQIEKDFDMLESFYDWIYKQGMLVVYTPQVGGKIAAVEFNGREYQNYLDKEKLTERLLEYSVFFNDLLGLYKKEK